jgi:dipeptidyl aminopeptidase/acylaminoacyl peptidase
MNIWVQDAPGSAADPRQLTRGPGGDYQANWSPDGRTIAFFSARAGTADIWSVDVESGEAKPVAQTASLDVNPFFSPDGKWIAFQSDSSGRLEVWVMRVDGSDARALTRTGVVGHFLRWTRDSEAVLYRAPGPPPRTMRVRSFRRRAAAHGGGGGRRAHVVSRRTTRASWTSSRTRTLWVSPPTASAREGLRVR